jgi:hypothetical protein
MRRTENPVCTTDFDLPTPPWGNEWGDPGEPHPAEPGASEFADLAPSGGTSEVAGSPGAVDES